MKGKAPSASVANMSELLLPNDTNTLGKMMGGRLMYWMDIAAAMAAMRHANRVCVTASVDHVEFRNSIELGQVVHITAKVTRAFTSSMEVRIEVVAEDPISGTRRFTNSAYFTFVAVDQVGRPIPVAPVEPETDEERDEYNRADLRRTNRLALAGRSSQS